MCGRFTLKTAWEQLINQFQIGHTIKAEEYEYRYNIAPSQNVLTIINDGTQNRLGYLKWGLIPSWAKDPSIGSKMINARAETIAEKASFKHPFMKKRCLVLADSFYEWKIKDNKKNPIRIRMKSDQAFAMAGLWERWTSSGGKTIFTCTIITTNSNKLIKPIHDRMPVILGPAERKSWLDRSIDDKRLLQQLLIPYPDEHMECYEVSSMINSPKMDGEQLILPI